MGKITKFFILDMKGIFFFSLCMYFTYLIFNLEILKYLLINAVSNAFPCVLHFDSPNYIAFKLSIRFLKVIQSEKRTLFHKIISHPNMGAEI